MKQSILDTNKQVINFALNEAAMAYLNNNENLYDVERILQTFPNINKTVIKPYSAKRELISRVGSIIGALCKKNIKVEEYISVISDSMVDNVDLMYISSKEISNNDVDNFIQAIEEALEKMRIMGGGSQVEQNQGNEAKPRQ